MLIGILIKNEAISSVFMEIKLIDIEKIDNFIQDFKKNILPLLQKISKDKGDFLYIDKMEKYLQISSSELRLKGLSMNFDFFNQCRKSELCLGGFLIRNPNDVDVFNRMYGLFNDELLKKDIYFIFLFLTPLFIGLNNNIRMYGRNSDTYLQFHTSYNVGKTYMLVKGIKNEIHRIYGNVYDFTVESNLSHNTTLNYEISIEKVVSDQPSLNDGDVRFYLQRMSNGEFIDTSITSNPQPFIALKQDSFLGSKKDSMVLYSGTFTNTSSENKEMKQSFRLRMWVSQDTIIDSISRDFNIQLNVTAKAI